MEQIMNGPDAFMHPASGRLIGPYEWYEGFGHTVHESTLPQEVSVETEVEDTVLPERLLKSVEKYGIDIDGKTLDEIKAAVHEAAMIEKAAKQAAKENGAGGNGEA